MTGKGEIGPKRRIRRRFGQWSVPGSTHDQIITRHRHTELVPELFVESHEIRFKLLSTVGTQLTGQRANRAGALRTYYRKRSKAYPVQN